MTYLENLKLEAAKTVEGLGATVRALEKQVASVEDRILFERGDVLRREENLAKFQDDAASKLTLSTSRYREWQNRFGRLTADLATARSALVLLETVIAPKARLLRQEARGKLLEALAAVYRAGRPRCQARMAELLDAVVAEHDAFFAACKQLHRDYGLGFATPSFDPGIAVEHARFSRLGKHTLISPMHYLAFTDPPAPAEAPVAVQDANTEKEVQGATEGEIVQPEPPGEAREAVGGVLAPTKPEREAPPVDVDAQDVPGPEKDAQDAPGATNGERLDSLDPPAEIAPEKCTTGASFLTGNVAEPDADAPPKEEAPPEKTAEPEALEPTPTGEQAQEFADA